MESQRKQYTDMYPSCPSCKSTIRRDRYVTKATPRGCHDTWHTYVEFNSTLSEFSFMSEQFNKDFCLMIAEDTCPACKNKSKLASCSYISHQLSLDYYAKIKLGLICPMCSSSKRDVKGWIDNLELPNNMSRFACPDVWHTPATSKMVGDTLVISGVENCTICGSTDKKTRNPVATPHRTEPGDAFCRSGWHCTCDNKFFVYLHGHEYGCSLKYKVGIDKAKEGADASATVNASEKSISMNISGDLSGAKGAADYCSDIWHSQATLANHVCPTCNGKHKYLADERIKASQKFEVGNVVRIKSGSPEMTIARFLDKEGKMAWVTYFERREGQSVDWVHTELVSTNVLVRVQSGPVGPT